MREYLLLLLKISRFFFASVPTSEIWMYCEFCFDYNACARLQIILKRVARHVKMCSIWNWAHFRDTKIACLFSEIRAYKYVSPELIFMRPPYHIRRNKRSRQAMTEDKSREEQHDPSILVRQIQRTRDKNLRIVLLERELRIRSPNNKKDKRLQTANSINIRQISSPLCWIPRCKKNWNSLKEIWLCL